MHMQLRGQHWQTRQPQPAPTAQSSPGEDTDMEMCSPMPASRDEEMVAAGQLESQISDSLLQVQGALAAAAERTDQVRLGRSTSLSGSPEAATGAEPKQATTPTSHPAMPLQPEAGSQALDGAWKPLKPMQPEMPCASRDVTMATQAAFSELNGMFTSSPLGAGVQIGAPLDVHAQHAAASAADVTMVTRNTFDSVNSMFQGALPQNCSWPRQAPGSAARSRPRMSLAGPMTARLLIGELATHPQRLALGPEPTITISTQAAFSTLNDMFRADLPHEAGRVSRANAPMQHATAPAAPGQQRPASAEAFPVYEDTHLLPGVLEHDSPAQPAGSQGLAMQMYVDTQFLGGPVHSPQQAGAPELQLYEDTQFIQENTAAAPALHRGARLAQPSQAGLEIYEDTRLMQENGPAAATSPGFQLYEDTQFIKAPRGAALGSAHMQQGPLQAGSVAVDRMGTPLIAGGHEGVTAYLAENVRPATPAVPGQDSFNSPTKNKVRQPMPLSASLACLAP